MSLLEADVSLPVVKQLTDAIKVRATGSEVTQSLTPDQQVVKIVNEELASLMGGTAARLPMASKPPTIILMAGLQGSGKTTFCAKLAQLRGQGAHRSWWPATSSARRPWTSSVLGEQIDVPVFRQDSRTVNRGLSGVREARRLARDVVIIVRRSPTVGEEMMGAHRGQGAVQPTGVVLVLRR